MAEMDGTKMSKESGTGMVKTLIISMSAVLVVALLVAGCSDNDMTKLDKIITDFLDDMVVLVSALVGGGVGYHAGATRHGSS